MTVVGAMFGFKYQYCKKRMVAYINGELDDRARRRVARYVDTCPRCYAEYQRQREIHRNLAADLPSFGRPQAAQLDRIWTAVKADLAAPSARRHPQPYLRVRYGVLMMLLITAMIFPLVFGSRSISQAAATPPTPSESRTVSAMLVTEAVATTDVILAEPTEQAMQPIDLSDETQAFSTPDVAPQRTPEATR